MRLSVVILNRDRSATLRRSLSALRAQDPPAHEIIVVDNGSSDASAEAVRERFPDVEVVALPDNVGYARGNNAGLERCSGRNVLLLNTDVRLERAPLERCLAVLEATPDAGVLGMQLLHADGRRQNSIHAFPGLATELLPLALLELLAPRRYPSKRYRHSEPIDVDAVQGAALLARRRVIEQVGPLPEEYFFFLEETVWC